MLRCSKNAFDFSAVFCSSATRSVSLRLSSAISSLLLRAAFALTKVPLTVASSVSVDDASPASMPEGINSAVLTLCGLGFSLFGTEESITSVRVSLSIRAAHSGLIDIRSSMISFSSLALSVSVVLLRIASITLGSTLTKSSLVLGVPSLGVLLNATSNASDCNASFTSLTRFIAIFLSKTASALNNVTDLD